MTIKSENPRPLFKVQQNKRTGTKVKIYAMIMVMVIESNRFGKLKQVVRDESNNSPPATNKYLFNITLK